MAARRSKKKTSSNTSDTGSESGSTAIEPEVLTEENEPSLSEGVSAASQPVVDVATDSSSGASVVASVASPPTGSTSSTLPVLRRQRDVGVSALEAFLQQVGRFPLLSLEEERELALRTYESGDPIAAKKLVVHNLRLVVKMAYKYRRAWANVVDLIQEGNVGLVEAVRRFDPFKGARFSTYASYWIRAYMIRYLLEQSRMVKVARTRAGRKMFFRLSKEREKLRALGIEPGPKLLAEKLGVSQKDFEEVAKHMDQPEVRLDAPISRSADGGGTVLDMLEGGAMSPETAAHQKAFAEDVGEALDSFGSTLTDEREIAAWNEHLMSDDPVSLSELGKRFGVTKQRMGQIVNGIRKRLKKHLFETLGPDVELNFREL